MIRSIWIAGYLSDLILELVSHVLSIKKTGRDLAHPTLPPHLAAEFGEWLPLPEFQKTLRYALARRQLGLLSTSIGGVLVFLFFLSEAPVRLLEWSFLTSANTLGEGFTPYLYLGSLLALKLVLDLPFSIYSTFKTEADFGFNRTTVKTFILDRIKGLILGGILGGAALWIVMSLFGKGGTHAWLAGWAGISLFQIILSFLAPTFIMPLFNKFSPIQDPALKAAIEETLARLKLPIRSIEQMDGSKRSSHGNAFFTGFGKLRKLVLFDTLIEKHPREELLAVLGHEVGHFKLGHVPRGIVLSLAITLVLFFGFDWVLNSPEALAAFGFPSDAPFAVRFGPALMVASLLFTPFNRVISIFSQWISRKHEYASDKFAFDVMGNTTGMIAALKRLSKENLALLDPHPLSVWLEASHPPIPMRVSHLRSLESRK